MTAKPAKANQSVQGEILRIGLTRDGRYLAAVIPESANRKQISREWILAAIKHKGFGDLFLLDESINSFVELYNSGHPSKRALPLAERRDAKISITVSDDRMNATISVDPPYGGKKLSAGDIKHALFTQGVKHGVQEAVVAKIEQTQKAENEYIAIGTPAMRGNDTKFQSLLPEIKDRKPKILENGMVDYRDFGEIFTVAVGTRLLKRVPPTKGINGRDVLGNVIEAEPGIETMFAQGLKGVSFDTKDPNVLIAAAPGQPIQIPNGVNVENVMNLRNVDLSTGNIVFDGSVHILGDITTGMTVDVTGDVVVDGIVEAANVKAGGNIVIQGSVIGHGDLRDKLGNLSDTVSKVSAVGSVSAKIVENSVIVAGDKIIVKEQVSKSEIDAVNEILVGGRGANLGQIFGGKARSGILIKTTHAGSNAGLKTILDINVDESVHQHLQKIEEDLVVVGLELQRVIAAWRRIQTSTGTPEEVVANTMEKKSELESRLKELNAEKAIFKARVERVYNGKIVVEKTVHSGTVLRIVNSKKQFVEDANGRPFKLEGKDIV